MKAERFCPVCKSLNPIGALRCIVCHASFESAPPPITTTPVVNAQPELTLKPSIHLQQLAQLPADALVLFVMDQEQPLIIRNAEQVILGRSEEDASETICDLTPFGAADLGVSRMHALITIRPEGCTITDLRSTNGTWLNERRLASHQPFTIQGGDRIRLGNLRLYPYIQASTQPEAAPEEIVLLVEAPSSSALFHPKITAHYLNVVLGPYLQALADVQTVIDESRGRAFHEVWINTISALRQDLPIGVSISGAPDAIRLLKTLILQWRVEHTGLLSDLYAAHYPAAEMDGGAEAAFDINNVTEQLNPHITRLMRVPDSAEPARRIVSPELQTALIGLAGQLLAEASPHLEVFDQPDYIQKLMPPLTVLAAARLQVSPENEGGGHKIEA